MKKKYEVSGNCPFRLEDALTGRWVDPSAGGFVEAEIDPTREAFLIGAGFLREAKKAPEYIKKDKE